MKLKQISATAIPPALELAERYRLLNEPEQAESICRDVLAIDPNNQTAARTLLLAIGDSFAKSRALTVQDAQSIAAKLENDYERHYYTGVVFERYARAKQSEGQPMSLVSDWISRAMEQFETAEQLRPSSDDAALLRWNTCARFLNRLPQPEESESPVAEAFDYA
jgi:hypothetical protein